MDNILAVHVETTGVNPETDQIVSISLIACNADFSPKAILHLYRKNVPLNLVNKSYQYHGISSEFLQENGLGDASFMEELLNFLVAELNLDSPIKLLGYNVIEFTKPFLVSLLEEHDIELRFSINHLDVYSLLAVVFEDITIKEAVGLFGTKSAFTKEEISLKKCLAFVNIFRSLKKRWRKMLDG